MKTKSFSLCSSLLRPVAAAACVWGLACVSPAMAQPAPGLTGATPSGSGLATLNSNKDKLSYATGVQAVRNFMKNDVAFDVDLIIKGMHDAMAGKELAMSEKEIRLVLNALQVELRRSMAANQRELGEKNRKRGADYLAAYKAKPGTQSLSNGVLYRVLQQGSGSKPSEGDSVIVKYRGTTIDGVEFDATEDGKTAILRVNQVIMGWREALKQMPGGAKWEIVIPSNLAYGERGVGNSIGPNEVLVFEVELVGVK